MKAPSPNTQRHKRGRQMLLRFSLRLRQSQRHLTFSTLITHAQMVQINDVDVGTMGFGLMGKRILSPNPLSSRNR